MNAEPLLRVTSCRLSGVGKERSVGLSGEHGYWIASDGTFSIRSGMVAIEIKRLVSWDYKPSCRVSKEELSQWLSK